jgi:hypothetical protein
MIKRNSFVTVQASDGEARQRKAIGVSAVHFSSHRLGYIVKAFASTDATKAFDNANFSRISSRC